MNKKILVACEESQVVTIELRKLGLQAFSCDVLDCSGGHPEWHLKQDVTELLCDYWDMIIAFPPCTHLAASGAKHFRAKQQDGRQQQAIDFFMKCINANSPMIAVENSIGIMSTQYRKPDQIIQPWQFGHQITKSTCLWLKNLPLLVPTNIVEQEERVRYPSGATLPKSYSNLSKKNRGVIRSKTQQGIGEAMASQWGKLV